MAVDPNDAAGTVRYRGAIFRFCSIACVRAFSAAPERYAKGTERADE
jgi:YHS domain-containing protein